MVFGKMQFNWEKHRPPAGRLSFGLFFRPILWRLKPVWWLCHYWPLSFPITDENLKAALDLTEPPITAPDTILPDHADQIIGYRDEFYGFPLRPEPEAFERGLAAARADDNKAAKPFFTNWFDAK